MIPQTLQFMVKSNGNWVFDKSIQLSAPVGGSSGNNSGAPVTSGDGSTLIVYTSDGAGIYKAGALLVLNRL